MTSNISDVNRKQCRVICKKKGSSIYAEGRLRTDSWTSKEGEPRFTNEIIANQVVFLDKRSDNVSGSGSESNVTPPTDNETQSDNLPW